MKKSLFTFIIILGGFSGICLISAFSHIEQTKPWTTPDVAKNKKNSVTADAQVIGTGKTLWATHCKSCHGNKGLGDGSKAAQLKTESGDFSKADFQGQTDGSMFYKLSEGRDDMPSFKKKVPDEDDRWALVHFIRTLKK